MERLAFLTFLVLSGCGTASIGSGNDAYWQDAHWNAQLFQSVGSIVQYPMDETGMPIGQPISAHAKVGFTYIDGKVADPRILQSSGRQDLDALMLQQVSTAHVPAAFGPHATEPHAFTVDLLVLSPIDAFAKSLYDAINAKRFYPKEAIIHHDQGLSTISFDYMDGKISDISVFKPNVSKALDTAAMQAVSSAQPPPSPVWLTIRPLHLRIAICYSLGTPPACSPTKYGIEIVNTPAGQPPSPPSGP